MTDLSHHDEKKVVELNLEVLDGDDSKQLPTLEDEYGSRMNDSKRELVGSKNTDEPANIRLN